MTLRLRRRARSCLLAASLALVAGCRNPHREAEQRLVDLWTAYQARYVGPAGDVRDALRDGQVTSEAQSYAMLRAAWMRDAAAFERSWTWTRTHLARPDGLFSWLWDPATNRVADPSSATDGDEDIAFALVLGARAFGRPDYDEAARHIMRAIREAARVDVRDGWMPSAGNWARPERITNFSYFAPYAYRYFDRLDPDSHWAAAIDSGYRVIDQATAGIAPLLPPDFVALDDSGRAGALPPSSRLSADFSYDGVRILWRLELDCRVMREPRACTIVDRLVERLERLRQRDGGRFLSRYAISGQALATGESPSFAAAFLPAYTRRYPEVAARWRQTTLAEDTLKAIRESDRRYYDANWVWFGYAAADGLIAERLPALDALTLH